MADNWLLQAADDAATARPTRPKAPASDWLTEAADTASGAATRGPEPSPRGVGPALARFVFRSLGLAPNDRPVQEGVVNEGLGPGNMLAAVVPGMRASSAVEAALPRALPWLARSAASGAANMGTFGAVEDASIGRNPLPRLPGNVLAGAVMNPALEGVAGAVRRLLPQPRAIPPVALAAEQPARLEVRPPAEPAPEVTPPEAVPTKAPEPTLTAKVEQEFMPVEKQPFAPTERAGQFPGFEDIAAKIEADPTYLMRLRTLGGGRRITNPETLQEAIKNPMHPDEIAAWKARTPANATDVARAGLTMTWLADKYQSAAALGNEGEIRTFGDALQKALPGYNNLTAEPGRATQAQSMFVAGKVLDSISELADMTKKGVPLEQVKQYAAEQEQALARSVKMQQAGENVVGWIRALETYGVRAKLTSFMTHAYNTTSNALTYFVSRPLEKAGTAAAYVAQGDLPAARASVQRLFGSSSGFVNGGRRFLSMMMDDAAPDAGKAAEAGGGMWTGRARWVDPFRWLAAADGFWKGALRDDRLYEMAYRSASAEGLTGKPLAEKIAQLTSDPPAAWLKGVEQYEKEHTFQADAGKTLQGIQKLQMIPGARFFIPFIKTPYNLIAYQLQRSPAGVLSPRNLSGLAAGGQQQAEAVGRLTAGGILGLTAYSIAARGEVTGPYPTDPGERARWDKDGIRPYSVKIGDRWFQYNRFAPLGAYLGQAAMLNDALHAGDEEGAKGIATRLAAGLGQQALDYPFLSGMSALVDAIQDPVNAGEKFFAGMAQGMIPNILRDVRYQTDETVRRARGIGPAVVNMIPGASQTLPPKVDVAGREMKYNPNRLERATKVLQVETPAASTPVTDALGWSPSMPNVTLTVGKKHVRLDGNDRADFEKDIGVATERVMSRLNAEAIRRMDAEQKDRLIDRIKSDVNSARRVVRERWQAKLRRAA